MSSDLVPADGAQPSLRRLRRVKDSAALSRLDPLRRLLGTISWAVLEARLVSSPMRYVLRELLGRSGEAVPYDFRDSGRRFFLRHRSGDVAILRKFFLYRYYDLPDPVAERLSASPEPLRLLDLGANIGLFAVHALSCGLNVGSVTAFEPDPPNISVLERTLQANLPEGRWTVVQAAASNSAGVAHFLGGRKNLSRRAASHESGGFDVPLVDALPYLAQADFAKLNIEGSEWQIIEDPRFGDCCPDVMVIEYHRITNPAEDIHAYIDARLGQLGLATAIAVRAHGENGLIWAWRPSRAD